MRLISPSCFRGWFGYFYARNDYTGSRNFLVTVFAIFLLSSGAVQADDNWGKVTFPTSCDTKVQAEFEIGATILRERD